MIALTYQARSTPYSLPAVRFPPAASRALAEARALIEQLGHVGVVADDSKIFDLQDLPLLLQREPVKVS